jgi:hypothetical protein
MHDALTDSVNRVVSTTEKQVFVGWSWVLVPLPGTGTSNNRYDREKS